jgi:hypothetical protein
MNGAHLNRLFRSAARASEPVAGEVPYGFETRVVALWRSGKNGRLDLAELSRFLRRAGVIASVVLVLAGAAAYRQYRDETKFAALATNEYVIADSAIQSEFSR